MRKVLSAPVERLTLREKVVKYLHNEIFHHRLQPGEKITEIDLSKHLGISRTPIREAFYQLEAEDFWLSNLVKGYRLPNSNPATSAITTKSARF